MSVDEKSPLEALISATFGVLHIAGEISGVPGLSTAVKLVEKIAELALNVPRNKYVFGLSNSSSTVNSVSCVRNQALQLSEECGGLCTAIKRASEGVDKPPESFIGKLLSEFTS